jgi:hypothetical protein
MRFFFHWAGTREFSAGPEEAKANRCCVSVESRRTAGGGPLKVAYRKIAYSQSKILFSVIDGDRSPDAIVIS